MSKAQSMYVHIPFCKNICSYCDFAKVFYSFSYEDKYLNSLFNEIETYNPNKCNTIYIGGGTPSVLTESGLDRLLSFLNKYLNEDYQEFTIEVNPETLNEEKVKIFKKYGINRISLGVQSFNDDILKILGRKHSYNDVKECVRLFKKYQLENYSFDFIYGINGLNMEHLKKDFEYIDELKPKHLSFYSLILEDNTCLKVKQYQELDEDKVVEQYDYIYNELNKRGFTQYEVSNYCKKGYESKHNLVYWKNKEYYGFGLGASGYLGEYRYVNTRNLTKYLNNQYDPEIDKITSLDQKTEFIMLALRLNEGISLETYKQLFKEDLLVSKKSEIDILLEQKLIKISNDRLSTTYKGMLLLDVVTLKLI